MRAGPTIKVAQFGLGPIGLETIRLAATKPWAEVVGGVDIDPAKIGKSLGELTGVAVLKGARVYGTFEELARDHKPDVIFHTSVSRLAEACAQLEPILRSGTSVISSSEELLFPYFRDAALAEKLDLACKAGNARALGTGVNPGYVMDVLPICLTGVCKYVEAIHVQRVVDATTRRGPLQRKIGSGMPPREFENLFVQNRIGHAGLKDSAALIAHCLGWRLTGMTESCEAVVATKEIHTPHVSVKPGQTCGLHQYCEGRIEGRSVITLDLKMYLDAPNPHDACQVIGSPPLRLMLEGGVAGDHATVAALVNAAPRLLKASPGLCLMTDIIVPCVS